MGLVFIVVAIVALLVLMHVLSAKDRAAEQNFLSAILTARTIQSAAYSLQKGYSINIAEHLPKAAESTMATVTALLSTDPVGRLHLVNMRAYLQIVVKKAREEFAGDQLASNSPTELLVRLIDRFSLANRRAFLSALQRRFVAGGGSIITLTYQVKEELREAVRPLGLSDFVS